MTHRTQLMALIAVSIILAASLAPAAAALTPRQNLAQTVFAHARDLNLRMKKIDEMLRPVLAQYKAHIQALRAGNFKAAMQYSHSAALETTKAVETIYKNHKDDIKAILYDIIELNTELYKLARQNKELAIKTLIRAGYKPDLAKRVVEVTLKYPVDEKLLHEAYNMIVSNDNTMKAAIDYIVHEELKHLMGFDKPTAQSIKLSETPSSLLKGLGRINTDSLALPGLTIHFKQLSVESRSYASGTDCQGNWFTVNVNDPLNTLFKVIVYDYSDYTAGYYYYELELWFGDEDHPNPLTNAIYDSIRKAIYGRIEDVESIAVYSSDYGLTWTVDFTINGGIWSAGYPYAYSVGIHGKATRTAVGSADLYVSNVWNHAMDTVNDNWCMQVGEVYPQIIWS